MADRNQLTINGEAVDIESAPDTPLLYVLTDELQMQGARFGCGLAQCGSCSVLVDGVEMRACVTPISALAGREITTLEGLPAYYARAVGLEETPAMTPLQEALIEAQALQCGYCYSGIITKATELLLNNPSPTTAQIKTAMNGHLCRCGTYPRIIDAIGKAAERMAAGREELA